MKTCPFCAEEIQDAAIVCKHCQRDLVPPAAKPRSELSGRDLLAVPPKKTSRGTKIVAIMIGLIALLWIAAYFSEGHQQFQVFAAKRTSWHQRCDAPRAAGRAADPERYDACAKELTALVAEAKAKGWS